MRLRVTRFAAPRSRGFTLIELLVALAILAIVSAIAVPIYTQYSIRTFRADAQKDLLLCGQGLERLASQTFTYALHVDTNADGIGDANTGPVSANICTPTSFNYAITVQAANANAFTVRAVPINGPVVGDGGLEADANGARRWDKNDNGNYLEAGEADWKE